MKKLSILLITLLSVACTETPDAQSPVTQSMLPKPYVEDGDAQCAENIPVSEQRGYEPALNAWLHASESVFVGTIKSVTQVAAPVYHMYSDKNGVHNRGIIDAKDCPTNILQAIRFEFENVETLHGKNVGSSLTIQMGRMNADQYLQIGFDEHGTLRDIEKRSVYHPGSRIGASLQWDNDGNAYWNYRQFEVIDNKVYLQDIDESKDPCSNKPKIIGIPNNLHGVPYQEFVDALTSPAATTELTPDQIPLLHRHNLWADAVHAGDSQQHTYTICQDGKLNSTDTNDENNRDSTHD